MIGSTILNIFVNELLAKEKNHIALHWLFRVIRARLQPPIKANDMPGKDLLKKVVVINKKGEPRAFLAGGHALYQ